MIDSSGMSSYSPQFVSLHHQNCCGIMKSSQVDPLNNFDDVMMKTVVNKRTFYYKALLLCNVNLVFEWSKLQDSNNSGTNQNAPFSSGPT
jgi:hypothetical protein